MSNQPSVQREAQVPAEMESVWTMITDARLISDWMESEVTLDPRPGGQIRLIPEDGPIVWGTIEEVIAPRRIQWSWRSDEGMPSLVEIELTEGDEPGFTVVTVTETLLPWRVSGPDGNTDFPQLSAVSRV